MNEVRGHAIRHATNVKFQLVGARRVRHRIISCRRGRKCHARELAGRKGGRPTVFRANPDNFDIVGDILNANNATLEASTWMVGQLVRTTQPCNGGVGFGDCPAGEYQPLSFLLDGERETRMLPKVDLAGVEAGLHDPQRPDRQPCG